MKSDTTSLIALNRKMYPEMLQTLKNHLTKKLSKTSASALTDKRRRILIEELAPIVNSWPTEAIRESAEDFIVRHFFL